MPSDRISIILPVYNQADHIEQQVREYRDIVARVPKACEFLLVVSPSRDNSFEVCAALARHYPDDVRVFQTAAVGWGKAVRKGIQEAGGSLICYTNSARTAPNDLLLLLLYALSNPHSVIKANRRLRESLVRRFGSLLYNLECRALFDLACWDINGTPKVFSRDFSALLDLQSDNDLIDIEFVVRCRRQDYRLLEVPMLSTVRRGGKSTTNWRSALRMYVGAYQMWRNLR